MNLNEAPTKPPRGGQTLLRGLSILEELASSPEGMSTTELARQTGLEQSAVTRLINALSYAGYIRKDPKTRQHRLTGKVMRIAQSHFGELDLRDVARPHLAALQKLTGETVHLGIREDDFAVYVDKLESTSSVRIASAIGRAMPLSTTALGKAIISGYPDEERQSICENTTFSPRTERSIRTTEAFMREVEQTVGRGYAIDNEENEQGVICVAAPVFGPEGVVAAISVSGPSFRMEDRVASVGESVRETVRRISREMGSTIAS